MGFFLFENIFVVMYWWIYVYNWINRDGDIVWLREIVIVGVNFKSWKDEDIIIFGNYRLEMICYNFVFMRL